MARSGEIGSVQAMEIWLLPFAAIFTRPLWLNAVERTTGALLGLNRRTVCWAVRATDGASDKGFRRCHRLPEWLENTAWLPAEGVRSGRDLVSSERQLRPARRP